MSNAPWVGFYLNSKGPTTCYVTLVHKNWAIVRYDCMPPDEGDWYGGHIFLGHYSTSHSEKPRKKFLISHFKTAPNRGLALLKLKGSNSEFTPVCLPNSRM